MKLTDLKVATQRTINKIAKASRLTPEEVLRRMLRPSNADVVTSHLDYGIRPANSKIIHIG